MLKVRDIVLIALLSVILFIQKLLLMNIPNVQLTLFLIMLFSKKLNILSNILICLVYVILDSIVFTAINGSMNLFFEPFIFLGLVIVPVTMNTIFKKVNNIWLLAIIMILYSLIYSWILIIPGCIMFEMDILTYLLGDIVWEISLSVSGFISVLILYDPLEKIFDNYLKTDW